MNVIQAVQDYITKMITNISGMKVLLLDKDTVGMVSVVYSVSQILQKEVFLYEKLDSKNRELQAHLKAVCFLRPTMDNLALLQAELKDPKYGEYHIFFTNTVKNSYIEELAEHDTHEVVQKLEEFFADYYAINTDTLSLNTPGIVSIHQPDWRSMLVRTVDGLASILLSLKKQPLVRYSGRSSIAQKVVNELQGRIQQEPALFDFKKVDTPPLLLVIDRVDDPITPLLTQWTYQAMVHEIFGLVNNKVFLKSFVPTIKKELEEAILSSEQDPWFKQTMYLNFGDLGIKIKELVDEYQDKSKMNKNIESLEDIKRFVEQFPEFKKMSGNVTKHVTIMEEISKIIETRSLLEVSEIEQEIANSHDHSAHSEAIKNALLSKKYSKDDLLRIVMLYALRYENTSNFVSQFTEQLAALGVDREKLQLVSAITQYAGSSSRTGVLFSKNLFVRQMTNLKRGLKGVQNIYTEHKPLLKTILDLVVANRLSVQDYPFLAGSQTREPPQDIIVFIVGGITYEESVTVHQFNTSGTGVRIVLGGTTIHNSKSFLKDLENFQNVNLR